MVKDHLTGKPDVQVNIICIRGTPNRNQILLRVFTSVFVCLMDIDRNCSSTASLIFLANLTVSGSSSAEEDCMGIYLYQPGNTLNNFGFKKVDIPGRWISLP